MFSISIDDSIINYLLTNHLRYLIKLKILHNLSNIKYMLILRILTNLTTTVTKFSSICMFTFSFFAVTKNSSKRQCPTTQSTPIYCVTHYEDYKLIIDLLAAHTKLFTVYGNTLNFVPHKIYLTNEYNISSV